MIDDNFRPLAPALLAGISAWLQQAWYASVAGGVAIAAMAGRGCDADAQGRPRRYHGSVGDRLRWWRTMSGWSADSQRRTHEVGWIDAAAGYILAWMGVLFLAALARPMLRDPTSALIVTYAFHVWQLAIPLFWLVVLRRRFPIGRLSWRSLSGWYRLWLSLALVIGLLSLASHGTAQASSAGIVAMRLLFQGVFVGPSEEFLFRGLIQTGLNNAIARSVSLGSTIVRGGTVLTALLFALAHAVNGMTQSVMATLVQMIFSFVIGLVIGHYVDKTGNLWGAAIAHNISDGVTTVVQLLQA